ncbi:hypothetical protein MAR_001640, partial [Mya arenaria]
EIFDTDQTSYGSNKTTSTDAKYNKRGEEVKRYQYQNKYRRRPRPRSNDTKNTAFESNIPKIGTMEPMDKTGQWLQETSKPIRPLTNKEATALSTVKKTPNSIFKWAANTKNRRKETHLPTLFERREDTDFVQEQYQACLRDFNTLSNVSSFTQTTQSDNYDKIAEVTDDSDSITSQKPLHKIWQKNVVFVPEVIPCHITGICMLPEGSLTIVDQENFRVKQFDPHLNYVSYHKVFEHPWDVCPVEHSDMAIGVFQSNVRQEIHVMSVSGREKGHTDEARPLQGHCLPR